MEVTGITANVWAAKGDLEEWREVSFSVNSRLLLDRDTIVALAEAHTVVSGWTPIRIHSWQYT